MKKYHDIRLCDLEGMMKPLPIFLPKGYFGKNYIQELTYDKEKDIYKKTRRIKVEGINVPSRELFNLRIDAMVKAGMIR